MLPISRRHAHYVFGVIQSGLTSLVASGIGSLTAGAGANILLLWMKAWIIAWVAMIPFVLLAAPFIRRLAEALTRSDG